MPDGTSQSAAASFLAADPCDVVAAMTVGEKVAIIAGKNWWE
jgi:hypothetical protein